MKSDPIVTVLALASIVIQAIVVLAVAAYALALALMPQQPQPPRPWVHPLAVVAEEAAQLTCKELRQALPGKAPSKSRKAALVAQLVAC